MGNKRGTKLERQQRIDTALTLISHGATPSQTVQGLMQQHGLSARHSYRILKEARAQLDQPQNVESVVQIQNLRYTRLYQMALTEGQSLVALKALDSLTDLLMTHAPRKDSSGDSSATSPSLSPELADIIARVHVEPDPQ